MAGLDLEREELGEVLVLALAGTVDTRGAAALRKLLSEVVAEGRRSLLLDLARLDSISGEALRTVATCAARLAADGGALALCRPTPEVLRVIEMARMDRRLEIRADREGAYAWLAATVRRERIARLAARLLRSAQRSGQRSGAGRADLARAAVAARLLRRATAGRDPAKGERG